MKTMTDKRGEAGRGHTERQPCSTMHEQGISVDCKLPLKKLSFYIHVYIPGLTSTYFYFFYIIYIYFLKFLNNISF